MQYTLVNGKTVLEMEREPKSGQMVPNILVTGKMIKLMAKESSIMRMVIFMKVIGWTTKLMEEECILMLMGLSTVENGKMINNMEKVLNPGQMELYMKVSTMKERKMVEVN